MEDFIVLGITVIVAYIAWRIFLAMLGSIAKALRGK